MRLTTHLVHYVRLCCIALLPLSPLALGADADLDGIDDSIDPRPGLADPKTVIDAGGYKLTVLGSNRVCSLEVSNTVFTNWNKMDSTSEDQRAVITKIYEQFGDEFDFVIFVNNSGTGLAPNQAYNVQNSVRGIGVETYDQTGTVGSGGKLQTYIRMASKAAFTSGPILHEILHRWSAFLQSIPRQGNDTHWYFAGVGGQHAGWEPGTLVDRGGGHYKAGSPGPFPRFGIASSDFGYGKFDLYLMGLLPANQVPTIEVAVNPSIASGDDFNVGEFSADSIRIVPMSEVIAIDGERLPSVANSQKYFHSLFVILTTAPVTDADWATFDRQAYEFSLPGDDGNPLFNFYEATEGRAEMSMNFLNYDLKTFAQPAITGVNAPPVGTDTAYSFAALEGATGYDRRVQRLEPATFTEGAENGLTNVTPTTTGGYNVLTNFAHAGSKGFRMTHIDGADQFLTLNRQIRPSATSKLRFYSRVGESLSGESAKVEVRTEGGVWKTIFNQQGDQPAESNFVLRNVSLADYAGKTIEVRFQWDANGSYSIDFDGTNLELGWVLDDIAFTDAEEVTSENVSDLGTDLTFNFTRPATGRSALQVRARIGQRVLRWGPEKVIGEGGGGTNNSPVAVDDVLDFRGASKLDVVGNDTDADGDPLKVAAVTQGAKGTVKLRNGIVTYAANPFFDGQDTFTYTVSDGRGGEDTGDVTVRNPFPALAGKYSAVVTQAGAPVGQLNINVTASGSVTGKLMVNGKTFVVKGLLAFDGTFTATFGKGTSSLPITFTITSTGGLGRIAGDAGSGTFLIANDTVLGTPPFNVAKSGRYTFLLPGGTTSGQPRGVGYAMCIVKFKGSMRLVGRLADDTPFTAGTRVRADETAVINVVLYKKPRGYLYGTLTFADLAGSDVSGTLAWSKPAQTPAGSVYPAGFNVNVAAVGSFYSVPLPGERVLAYPDPANATATVSFSGPELPGALMQTVQVSTADKISIVGDNTLSLTLTINRSTGLFQGSLAPVGQAPTAFNGVFLQKGNRGQGVRITGAETASVSFAP